MRRVSLAVVAGAAVAAVVLLLILNASRSSATDAWVLTYTKPTGPADNSQFEGVEDPTPNEDVNHYVGRMAADCDVEKYTVEYQEITDVNDMARAIVPEPTEPQRSCLRKKTHHPFVTFKRVAA